jgi:RNA polymerase sigma factor (sigma-70 family)
MSGGPLDLDTGRAPRPAAQGRDARVGAVYRDKAMVLRRFARGLTHDGELADDLVQEAFVRTLRARRAPEDPDELFYYLVTVVLNLTRSHAARAARRARRSPPPAREVVESRTGDVDEGALGAAVAGLPRRQREVVYLRFWLDLSVDDTARALGMSSGSVKTHSARALEALRRALPAVLEEDGR